MAFWTYMLICADGSYYVGHTDNLESRVACHERGEVSGYTQSRRPVRLCWSQPFVSRVEALAAERRIKGWSRAKKAALAVSDWAALNRLSRGRHRSQREALAGVRCADG